MKDTHTTTMRLAVAMIAVALMLTACDPYPSPDRTDEAWVYVEVRADGSASTSAHVDLPRGCINVIDVAGLEPVVETDPVRRSIAEQMQERARRIGA